MFWKRQAHHVIMHECYSTNVPGGTMEDRLAPFVFEHIDSCEFLLWCSDSTSLQWCTNGPNAPVGYAESEEVHWPQTRGLGHTEIMRIFSF